MDASREQGAATGMMCPTPSDKSETVPVAASAGYRGEPMVTGEVTGFLAPGLGKWTSGYPVTTVTAMCSYGRPRGCAPIFFAPRSSLRP